MAIDRAGLMPILRHECGHLFIARAVGFPTDGIELLPRAGAHIELQISLSSLDELCNYIERRVKVLFAGAIGQSIQGGVIRQDVAYNLLNSPHGGAGHDFAKIKELIRLLVGVKFPNANAPQYADELKAADTRLSDASAQIVSDNITAIDALAIHFLDKREMLGKTESYHLPQAEIDAFLDARASS